MKTTVKSVVLAGLFALIPGLLWSYAPVIVFVAAADVTSGSGSSEPLTPGIAAGAEMDWRAPAGKSGYVALWSSARVEAGLLGGIGGMDRETFGFELGGFPAGIDVSASAGITASTGLLDSPAQLEPSWNLTGLVPLDQRPISLGAAYSGTYQWRESDTTDRLENRLSLRAVSEPDFTAGYQYDLTGGLDLFPGTYLDGVDGTTTGEQRRDALVFAAFSADVISDYFTRWNCELKSGARFSNATRYIPATATLEAASEDRVFGSVAAGLAISPVSSLAINFSLTADAAHYLGRAALNENGQPLDANLGYIRSTAGVNAAWSPTGRLFLIGSLIAAGAVSNDPLYAGWTATAEFSAEWRL
jgi:hypothetical protein